MYKIYGHIYGQKNETPYFHTSYFQNKSTLQAFYFNLTVTLLILIILLFNKTMIQTFLFRHKKKGFSSRRIFDKKRKKKPKICRK